MNNAHPTKKNNYGWLIVLVVCVVATFTVCGVLVSNTDAGRCDKVKPLLEKCATSELDGSLSCFEIVEIGGGKSAVLPDVHCLDACAQREMGHAFPSCKAWWDEVDPTGVLRGGK